MSRKFKRRPLTYKEYLEEVHGIKSHGFTGFKRYIEQEPIIKKDCKKNNDDEGGDLDV